MARLKLIVLYTEQLAAAYDFLKALGLPLVEERHGSGPVHYSVTLENGIVLEIYPGSRPPRFQLEVGSIEESFSRLTSLMPSPEHTEVRIREGQRYFVTTDPDGRRFELIE